MKFLITSPDSLMFDRNEFKKEKSRNEQILLSILAIMAVGSQIALFIMVHKLLGTSLAGL